MPPDKCNNYNTDGGSAITTGAAAANSDTWWGGDAATVGRRTFLTLTGMGFSGTANALVRPTGQAAARDLGGQKQPRTESGWEPQQLGENIDISTDHPVLAYTTVASLEPGSPLELCVSSSESYSIEVYRLGWYGGDGGERVHTADGSMSYEQELPSPEAETRMVRCDWEVTDEISETEDWETGLYYVWVRTADAAYAHPFVVRPRTPSAEIVVHLPIATQQAYNGWGGAGLYGHVSEGGWDGRSIGVSHDRPFRNPFSRHLNYAIHFIRWLEAAGYDADYVENVDVHRDPNLLREYEVMVPAGHDEYWSLTQFDAFTAARDDGVNLAVMGANVAYRAVEYRDNERYYLCDLEADPEFRNHGRNELNLKGMASYGHDTSPFEDLSVDPEGLEHPYMAGTGFEGGDTLPGVVGHEWSWLHRGRIPEECTRFFVYEGTEGRGEGAGGDQPCDVITFDTESGATVFHCGTLAWTWVLDPDPTWDPQNPGGEMGQGQPPTALQDPDERVQRLQDNVIDDLVEGESS